MEEAKLSSVLPAQSDVSLDRRLVGSIALSVALLVGCVALTLWISYQSTQADRWVVHTLEVRRSVRDLLTVILNAETGQRGYMLTGEQRFLAPYDSASHTLPQKLKQLQALVADNPQQAERVEALIQAATQRLQVMARTIDMRARGATADAVELVRSGPGLAQMTQIRSAIEQIETAEQRLQSERQATVALRRRQLVGTIIGMLAACSALTGFALLSLRRYAQAMRANREQLAVHNAELEQRVQERTSELASAVELANRERTRAESMLVDVNHRVGNNLALVSSFLAMQQRAARNPEALQALSTARMRVQAIASAHRKLRLGSDFATVKVAEVLTAVIDDIIAGLPMGEHIRIHHQFAPIEIHARDAVSLGVLANELVMNAVKHAFSAGQAGQVNVILAAQSGTVPFLEVSDDGVGFHEKQVGEAGLGAKIVDMVARQFGSQPQRSSVQRDEHRPGSRIRVDLVKLTFAPTS